MSDPREPPATARTDGQTRSGVAELPGDRTQEVRARPAGLVADEEAAAAVAPGPVTAYEATSGDLAAPSRRARRRERDHRAERRAIQVVLGLFVGVGGLALLSVNLLLEDPPPSAPAASSPTDDGARTPPPPPDDVISAPVEETVDLPALRKLRNEGLTIVAEGLPEVSTDAQGPEVGPLAARETCRFAYGVWELSPNRRFRFMPTCPSMDGQVLFGAYSVQGGVVRMSPLRVSGVQLVSEFQVEKPSRLVTRVDVGGGRVQLRVRQRVTVIRGGLFGDSFYRSYAPKNTLSAPGQPARRPPPGEPPPPAPKTDPLLELLRGDGKR